MKFSISRIVYRGSASQLFTYLIVLLSMFMVYFSFNNSSFGRVCIGLTIILFLFNFKSEYYSQLIPFAIVCIIVLLLLVSSGRASERGFNASVNHSLKFIHLMFTVALSTAITKFPDKERHTILKWTILSILISTIISLYYVIRVDKYAIRYSAPRGFNMVIGFDQFYGVCIFLCILVFALLSWHKKFKIGKYVFLCVILLICVGLSLFVTGVLLCGMGIGVAIAINKYSQSKRQTTLCAIGIIFALILVFVFSDQISDLIYKMTEPLNWILRDRIRNVADTIFRTDHNLVYSYDRRAELAGYSMDTFRKYPFFGIGYKGYEYGVIGCHQEWQDMLGVFGIFGMLLVVLLVVFHSRYIIKNITRKSDLYSFYMALLLFVVLGFLNPCLTPPVLCSVFIVAPNASYIFPNYECTNLK